MTNKLAQMLSQLRVLKGASLREVEAGTEISNAYLSQLERGVAEKPAPEKLKRLARFYGVPYESLLEAAGYIEQVVARSSHQIGANLEAKPTVLQNAIESADLTEEEEAKVVEYIAFLRSRK